MVIDNKSKIGMKYNEDMGEHKLLSKIIYTMWLEQDTFSLSDLTKQHLVKKSTWDCLWKYLLIDEGFITLKQKGNKRLKEGDVYKIQEDRILKQLYKLIGKEEFYELLDEYSKSCFLSMLKTGFKLLQEKKILYGMIEGEPSNKYYGAKYYNLSLNEALEKILAITIVKPIKTSDILSIKTKEQKAEYDLDLVIRNFQLYFFNKYAAINKLLEHEKNSKGGEKDKLYEQK